MGSKSRVSTIMMMMSNPCIPLASFFASRAGLITIVYLALSNNILSHLVCFVGARKDHSVIIYIAILTVTWSSVFYLLRGWHCGEDRSRLYCLRGPCLCGYPPTTICTLFVLYNLRGMPILPLVLSASNHTSPSLQNLYDRLDYPSYPLYEFPVLTNWVFAVRLG